MPARLSEEGDVLVVRLSGSKEEFQDQLAKVKLIPGRRFNPEEKTWELPNDLETLLKVVHTLEPEMPAILQAKIKKAKAEMAQELVTKLADDAALAVPWHTKLAPKQRAGIDFLTEHPHSLLADEMGSGKTVQAISTVYEYQLRLPDGGNPIDNPEEYNFLVVCPNSVTGVWERELRKWVGDDVPITIIDAKTKPKRIAQLEQAQGWVIVNWEKLRIMPELAKRDWDAVIADESHRAKNRKAQQTKALWKLTAPVQLALSGTPIMNDPGELWPVLRWLRPEQYTSYWAFYYNYTDEYTGYKGRHVVLGVKNADALRFELSDKMVRRTKREIHADIPEKLPPDVREIPMKPKQAKLYEEAEKAFWLEIVQEAQERDAAEGTDANVTAIRNIMDAPELDVETLRLMLPNSASRLVRQRQIATSPAVLGGPDDSGKLDALIEIIEDEPDRPFVVFAWYKDTVRLIAERLRQKKISVETFTGDTPADHREQIAEDFQAGEFRVIVLTIMAGGVGIDLFRASTCIFVEQDWVPAINNQAIDRLHRKGQTDDVQAIFLQSRGTVDTGRIAPKNKLKEAIVTSILGDET